MGIGVSPAVSALTSAGGGAWFHNLHVVLRQGLELLLPFGQLGLQVLHVLQHAGVLAFGVVQLGLVPSCRDQQHTHAQNSFDNPFGVISNQCPKFQTPNCSSLQRLTLQAWVHMGSPFWP